MTLQILGQTTHFIVRYDDAAGAPGRAVAQALLNTVENDLARLAVHLPTHMGEGGDPFLHPTIDVQVLNIPLGPAFASADNNGFGPGRQSRIRINPFAAANTQITDDYAGFVFIAEMSELIMGFYGWNEGSGQGEALSRVMAEELHPASTSNFVNTWLAFSSPRPDWINKDEVGGVGLVPRGDLDPITYGCGIIFINFLNAQLGFSFRDICLAGGALLSDRYRNLTHRVDNPAATLDTLLDVYLGTGRISLSGNNPFPLDAVTTHGVLLVGGFRTHRELQSMSRDDKRNTLIVELTKHSRQSVAHFQSLDDRALAGAGAVMVYLRLAGFRSDANLTTMSDDDQRNTLIVEIAAQTGRQDLQTLDNHRLVLAGLETTASPIRAVLLIGRFRTHAELLRMSHEDQRNTLIVELAGHTQQPVSHFQGLDDTALAGAGAVMVYMRQALIRTDADLKTMTDDGQRNTLIVEIASQTGRRDLQALDNLGLVQVGLLG